MKKIQLVLICLIMCSCQSLRLSNLTNDIIKMYISQNPEEKIENICIHNWEDNEEIVVAILNYSNGMKPCSDEEDYWGTIRRDAYNVVVYGTLNKLFIVERHIIPQKNPCTDENLWFWDPTEWIININKYNKTVSISKTSPFIDENDLKVDDLKELVESYIHK